MSRKIRLAILASHPIEYQGPLFQRLAKHPEIDLHVYYCWKFGVGKETFDPGFNRKISWDIPLLEGYSYSFLTNFSLKPSGRLWGEINPGIITKINQKRHDALLVFGWSSLTSWLGYGAAFVRGVPVFVRGENPFNQELSKPKWKIFLKKFILGFLFGRVAGIFYIGEENKRFYQYYGASGDKLFFAPYAVDNERFSNQGKAFRGKKSSLKKELGIKPKKLVILFVGKLIPLKRPMDLLRAYHTINNRAALVFVGDGVLRPELEEYVKLNKLEDVRFVGFRNQSELPKYYSMADVFILASDSETWGLVVNEAMGFGLPVIVSDVPGCVPDLVKHGRNGYIFPVGDIPKLVTYLKELIDKPRMRELFGRKSLEIIQNYTYKKDIEMIVRVLAGLSKRGLHK